MKAKGIYVYFSDAHGKKEVLRDVSIELDDVLKRFCNICIRNFEISQPDLEDVFLQLVR